MKIKKIKLGQTVYHKNLYDCREEFKVVGIREDEVELEGDYSGMHNIIEKDWMPLKGLSFVKNSEPYFRNSCKEWDDVFKEYLNDPKISDRRIPLQLRIWLKSKYEINPKANKA